MTRSVILISKDDITKKVSELAKDIAKVYQGKPLIMIGVLTGSFIFASDLLRELWNEGIQDVEVDFVSVSSYGHGKESSRNPVLIKDLKVDIEDKDVLVVEDIIDTGYTLEFLHELLSKRNPKSLKTVVLLSKPSKKEVQFTPDFIGFEIDGSYWVQGYGLDGGKYGRGCPDVEAINS